MKTLNLHELAPEQWTKTVVYLSKEYSNTVNKSTEVNPFRQFQVNMIWRPRRNTKCFFRSLLRKNITRTVELKQIIQRIKIEK